MSGNTFTTGSTKGIFVMGGGGRLNEALRMDTTEGTEVTSTSAPRRPCWGFRAGQGHPRKERRTVALTPADIRVTAKDKTSGLPTEYTATVLRYGVLDDYWTKFRPGVFTDSLSSRMPRVVWSHDWSDPIGIYDDVVTDDDDGLTLHAKFADFEHVPNARRASSLMQDGIIDQFSVGFYRESDEEEKNEPVVWITKGDLVEASPVLAAAVPGTALVGMRASASGLLVPRDEVERIIVQAYTDEVPLVEVLNALMDVETVDETDLGDADNPDKPEASSPDDGPDIANDPPAPDPATHEDDPSVGPQVGPTPVYDPKKPPPDPAAADDTPISEWPVVDLTGDDDVDLASELDELDAVLALIDQ